MRRYAVLHLLLVLVMPALAQEAEVRNTLAEYSRAWSAHNAAEIATFYGEDADVFTGAGSPVRGRQAIEQMHAREFGALPKDSRLTLTVSSIRFIQPDYAFVDGTYQTGSHGAVEHAGEGIWGVFSMLLRHERNQWLIVAFRPGPDPRAFREATNVPQARAAAAPAEPEPGREVRGLGSPFSAEERNAIVSKLLANPKVAGRIKNHRVRPLAVVEDANPDPEKSRGGPTRRVASVVLFDYTAGDALRFSYDVERSEITREEVLKGQPTPSQEERDVGSRIIRGDPQLAPLLREGAVIEGGFNDDAPAGGSPRDRYLQYLLLSRDRRNLLKFVVVDLTTEKVAAVAPPRKAQ